MNLIIKLNEMNNKKYLENNDENANEENRKIKKI